MTKSPEEVRPPAIPPVPAEDHVCPGCEISYRELSIERALAEASQVPGGVRAIVAAVPAPALHTRPHSGIWSITEYVCHLRDVYTTYTIRLHRTRTEDRPPWSPC